MAVGLVRTESFVNMDGLCLLWIYTFTFKAYCKNYGSLGVRPIQRNIGRVSRLSIAFCLAQLIELNLTKTHLVLPTLIKRHKLKS